MDTIKNEEQEFLETTSILPNDFDTSQYVMASVIGFLILALFLILRKRTSPRRDFILTGLSECGKSAVFMCLLYKKFPQTFVSIRENFGTYKSGGLSCRLIDIPGHYKVRDKFFDEYKRSAKGIIFVLDSVTVQKDIHDISDALYTVLTDVAAMPCPILVLCNKQDMATAKSAQVVKDLLEKEMNLIRDTRSRKLQTVGGEEGSTKSIFLGKPDKDFEWSHIPQNIQFYECSAKEQHIKNLTDWLDRML